MKFSPLFALAVSAMAVVPEARVRQNALDKPQPPHLPNLIRLDSVSDLSPKWITKGDMRLEEGRLVVKDGMGSIWSKEPLAGLKGDWTIEVVFRNSERVEVEDHLYFDSNGFSFWLLESDMPLDGHNFGGPKSYEGFQFLINNKEGRGLKIFANDGKQILENSKSTAFGGCDLNYLDSMIPFTMRLSYSSQKKIFKVQVDNNLCFRTDTLSFDKLSKDFIFGVSASTDVKSQEYWELLKLDTYYELTEDALDDHDLMKEGLIKMVTITQTDESKPTDSPAISRQLLMEKSRSEGSNVDYSKFDAHINEINRKLSLLESTLDKIDNKQVSELSLALQEVKNVQNKQQLLLEDMKKTHDDFQALLRSHYREMVSSVGALHQKVIDEIKVHQAETHNIETKVDLLMANHKEILKQYMSYAGELERKSDSSEFVNAVVKWVLLPFFVLIAGLSLLVYRLRRDIKHIKII